MPRTVSNVVERSTKGHRNQENTGKDETYKMLAGKLMESLKREVVVIKMSAGACPHQSQLLQFLLCLMCYTWHIR